MRQTPSTNKAKIFRAMYGVNLLGAGIPGAIIVFFPNFAEQYVLWEGQDPAVMSILGSIWFSIGLVSALGILYPYRFLPVFVLQFTYKSVWLLSYVLPLSLGGRIPPNLLILIVIFIVLLLEFALFIRLRDFRSSFVSAR